MEITPLEVSIGTAIVAGGILTYIKIMKRKVRRYVLRNDKIDKYYK
jgi:hypothetical protein